MSGVNVTLYRNSNKIWEISSNSKILEAIKDVKEKTNAALTDIIEKSNNGEMAAGLPDEGAEDSEDEEGDPQKKKIKLS